MTRLQEDVQIKKLSTLRNHSGMSTSSGFVRCSVRKFMSLLLQTMQLTLALGGTQQSVFAAEGRTVLIARV